jgi:hypothetical protein
VIETVDGDKEGGKGSPQRVVSFKEDEFEDEKKPETVEIAHGKHSKS